jgi:acyl-CoA synthetase (AMP-forming)/AMP-acid ligase II
VLYNLYGSTEVAWATIASPRQLRAAPGTAGTPPYGTRLRLFDEQGRELRGRGETGRIFVHNEMVMDGYTTGDGKAVLEGLIATGDVGYVDREGRLFVSGRDDEMIVSGGENVFPREVEDLLADYPGVEDVAVIGVRDREFGERLRAFIVPEPGTELDAEAVKAHVRDNLARFKVPRDVLFVGAPAHRDREGAEAAAGPGRRAERAKLTVWLAPTSSSLAGSACTPGRAGTSSSR